MKERFEEKSCPQLKKQMEPLEVYQNRKESQSLEELVLLEGDDHAIHTVEGLSVRERILGNDNTVLRDPIRYRGAKFADEKFHFSSDEILMKEVFLMFSFWAKGHRT